MKLCVLILWTVHGQYFVSDKMACTTCQQIVQISTQARIEAGVSGGRRTECSRK